jgi:hypothetical protein
MFLGYVGSLPPNYAALVSENRTLHNHRCEDIRSYGTYDPTCVTRVEISSFVINAFGPLTSPALIFIKCRILWNDTLGPLFNAISP